MIGKTISHFRILEEVGRGGMGVVYRAHDQKLDRFVALKFLPRRLPGDHGDQPTVSFEERKRRFTDEAKAASSLDHANICTIYDIDETEDGNLFIAMAWYGGETLKAKIARGPLPIGEVLDYGSQITTGLAAAHARGLVHRDIKPANVMVTEEGVVKILDFGLSKFTADGPSDFSAGNQLIGTAAYMSPEQVDETSVDHQSDLWATAVVLYEMATGTKPFHGANDLSVLFAVINHEPEFPVETIRTVPRTLRGIIEMGLAKDRSRRYPTAEALRNDLEALRVDSSSVTLVAQRVRWVWRRRGRRRWPWIVAATGLLTLLALAGWWWSARSVPPSPPVVADAATVIGMGFQNQAAEADRWLCTALADLAVFLVPDDGSTLQWIMPTDAEVASLQDTAGYDVESGLAATVRQALVERTQGARALTGRCRVVGDTGQVDLDVRLEDLQGGETHGRSAYAGSQADLLGVATAAMAPLAPLLGRPLRVADPSWSMPPLARDTVPLLASARQALRELDAPTALADIEEALRLQPFHPQLLAVHAETLLRSGRIRDARTSADRALRAVRRAPLAVQVYHRARVLEVAGAPARAAALFRMLWPVDGPPGDDPEAWIDRGLDLARLLVSDGQEEAATTVLNRLRAAEAHPSRIALIEAMAARGLARNEEQLAAARRGLAQAVREETPLLWARARHLEAEPLRRLGQPEQALEALREAREVYVAGGSEIGAAGTWNVEGVIRWDQQDLVGAKSSYETAARLFRALGDDGHYGRTLQNLALIEGQLGDVAVAVSLFRTALERYDQTGDRIAEVTTWFNLAELWTHAGQVEQADEAYRQALRIDTMIESRDTHAALYSAYGEFQMLRGELVAAEGWLNRAIAILGPAADRLPLAIAEQRMAALRLAQGDPKAALAAAERALSQFAETDVGAFRVGALKRASEILLAMGNHEAAVQRMAHAVGSLGALTDGRPAGELLVTRAILARETGDLAEGMRLAHLAAETLLGSGSVLELAQAYGVRASLLLSQGRVEAASEAVAQARKQLEGTQNIPIYEIPIALIEALTLAAGDDPEVAVVRLRELLVRCKNLGAGHLELQVGLALAETELASGNPSAGRARLRQVERGAVQKGFGTIQRKAEQLAAR